MTTAIIPRAQPHSASADNDLVLAVDRAREYADASHATATRRAYASHWRVFTAWCVVHALTPLPASPQTVTLYLTQLADRAKLATVRHHLASIVHTHREHGFASPGAHDLVKRVLQGITRTLGAAQAKKSAITVDALRAMLLEIRGDGPKAKRDRAILLLGFSAALRRSEIATLDVDDVAFCKEGLRITIRRSKTDQTGEGSEIAVPRVANETLCAVRAVKAWLDAAGITEGPVFRSFSLQRQLLDRAVDGRAVANLVQSLARRAHLEGDFGGHSLRAGFATSAARAKVALDSIARTTRHKSLAVLMGYVRPAQAFDDVALTQIIQ